MKASFAAFRSTIISSGVLFAALHILNKCERAGFFLLSLHCFAYFSIDGICIKLLYVSTGSFESNFIGINIVFPGSGSIMVCG